MRVLHAISSIWLFQPVPRGYGNLTFKATPRPALLVALEKYDRGIAARRRRLYVDLLRFPATWALEDKGNGWHGQDCTPRE